MPERIQLRRTKGWRLPENTVKVDRSTPFGNPYVAGPEGFSSEYLVGLYRDYLARPEQAMLVAVIRDRLRGKNLACWCPPGQPCHADVLLELANA